MVLAFGATSVAQADTGGAALGGILGAVVGSQVGGGNGRVAATAVGAIIGSQVGDKMTTNPPVRRAVYQPREQYGAGGDPELEAARAQGRAERERAARQQAIQAAYQCGRDGSC
ncbi:MAG: 17 kDa surface antigen [Candidatus Curtissbacteria bacterium GW2011_GWA1_40_47]|uniref:17 kDa surface antigen n=1 Tax=Candidatus Nomurabacteria bacterium GW2011_GWC2_42_20 TaxID=1618756 RepID=A0A0G1BKZ2_9BACT|nr:MAG: 17 kDa surface antigen [Candidatus Curtissbacteria bacterium GW2011_GWA1_40_47]KKS46961.1 MAG: 17 kDa surface antigen [Candidatus Nomurabacteria bacterium GW2011_GWC2_42_20]KKS58670.1 MAG: 17 kDa surface antigen [Candidatus Nomurabacteria bacterium GW2011_GWA2_42_41]KKT08924.1 MAG: 17 kDa surface antigen [Candidatus Nomurabacteria bacterium GW2011_GWB1_43_20]